MEKKKISFQGLKGAYSDLACRKFYHEYETYPCSTFEQTLEAVNKNKAELALIPVENNIAGRVADMHVLLQSLKLRIVAENYLKIEHNLLITKDNNFKIKVIKVKNNPPSVDTLDDLEKIRLIFKKNNL